MHRSANGLEKMRECGRSRKALKDCLMESLSVAWPDAFCMMPLRENTLLAGCSRNQEWNSRIYTHLSIIVMIGATIHAAVNPEVKSAARRRPRCFVFHTRVSAAGFTGRMRAGVESRDSFGDGMSTRGFWEVMFCSFQLKSKFHRRPIQSKQ